jgi:hypothetical protein
MMVQEGRSPRFCVYILWWVQYFPNAYRTPSAVLCIVVFAFPREEKKSQKKKSGVGMAFQRAGWQLLLFSTPGVLGLLCAIKS